MRIDIFSDPICPWCYIGKRRLEQALASYHNPLKDLEIVWRAFQLNPDMPEEGMDRQIYLTNKFGGEERARQIYQNIKQVGEAVELDFQFDAIRHTPSTIKSHRLIRLAHGMGKQNDFTEELFKAYFLEGQNIEDNEVLLKIATEAGMEKESTTDFLASDRLKLEVIEEDKQARAVGLNGVPCFIVDNKFVLSGAQEPQSIQQVFDLALQEAGELEAS